MNKSYIALILSLFLATTVACDGTEANPEAGETAEAEAADSVASVTLEIEGMDCVSCAANIEDSFEEAEGVDGSVDFGAKIAEVDYDPELIDDVEVVGLVEEAGFDAGIVEQ